MPTPSRKSKPKPKVVETKPMEMDFYDALREVYENKRSVTRLEWNNPNYVMAMSGSLLCVLKEDNLFHPLMVSDGDLAGKDWIVV